MKHLSDSQLIELSAIDKRHLDGCEFCTIRQQEFDLFSDKLRALPQKEIESDLFLRIIQSNDLYQKNRKLRFWKQSSFALAACVAFVSIFSFYQWTSYSSSADNLNDLISLNNKVQNSIASVDIQTNSVAIWQNEQLVIQERIKNIDRELQNAYLKNLPENEIYDLWSQRLLLLEELRRENSKKRMLVRI